MEPKANLRLAITLILTGPTVTVAYDARMSPCITALAEVSMCQQRPLPPDIFFPDEPGSITLRYVYSPTLSQPLPAPVDEEIPLLLRSSATFFANECQPQRRDLVQIEQQGRNHTLLELKPTSPPNPDETPLPDHIEPENPETSLGIGQTSAISAGPSAPGGANAIRQIIATSAQFPAAYEEAFIKRWRGNLLITTPVGNQQIRRNLKKSR